MLYPCKDCTDRYPTCHDKCDRYQKVKLEVEKRKQIISAGKEPVAYIVDAIRNSKDQRAKRRRESAGAYKWSK